MGTGSAIYIFKTRFFEENHDCDNSTRESFCGACSIKIEEQLIETYKYLQITSERGLTRRRSSSNVDTIQSFLDFIYQLRLR